MKWGFILLFFFVFFVSPVLAEGELCYSDSDCDAPLYCENQACVSAELVSVDTGESVSAGMEGDPCALPEDCASGYACSEETYTCALLDSLSTGSCQDDSTCDSGDVCYEGSCITDLSVDAGITGDNPFLGSLDSAVDSLLGSTLYADDENYQLDLAAEDAAELSSLEERHAKGWLSQSDYFLYQASTLSDSSRGLELAAAALAQKAAADPENVGLETAAARLEALASGTDTKIHQLEADPSFQASGASLNGAKKSFHLADENFQEFRRRVPGKTGALRSRTGGFGAQGEQKTLLCMPIRSQRSVGSLAVRPLSDGSLDLVLSDGSSFTVSHVDTSFFFSGERILVYAPGESKTGSEVVLLPLNQTSYNLSLDSSFIAQKNLKLYGEPLFALGTNIVYSYDPSHLLVGKNILLAFSSEDMVGACQVLPQNASFMNQSLRGNLTGNGSFSNQSRFGNRTGNFTGNASFMNQSLRGNLTGNVSRNASFGNQTRVGNFTGNGSLMNQTRTGNFTQNTSFSPQSPSGNATRLSSPTQQTSGTQSVQGTRNGSRSGTQRQRPARTAGTGSVVEDFFGSSWEFFAFFFFSPPAKEKLF